jgi:hypothetical protein
MEINPGGTPVIDVIKFPWLQLLLFCIELKPAYIT